MNVQNFIWCVTSGPACMMNFRMCGALSKQSRDYRKVCFVLMQELEEAEVEQGKSSVKL